MYLLCKDGKSKSIQVVRDGATTMPGSLNVSFVAILTFVNIDVIIEDRLLHRFSIIVPFLIIRLGELHLEEEG